MKRTILAAALVLLAVPTAAQAADLDVGTGAITPDSIFYGLDIALDNAGMAIGLERAGTIVQERAAEARAMQERNDTAAMMRAAEQARQVAQRATADDAQGLQKARQVLEQVRQRTPEQARAGLDQAIGSISDAQQRVNQQGPDVNDTTPNGSAGGTRPEGSGDFEDTPDTPTNPGNDSGQ